MSPSRHTVLLNAFTPAKEVDDPEFFAGRAAQVVQLTDALHVIGSCPIIYGNRGLGKTSLAVQIRYIAAGDDTLLESLGLIDRGTGRRFPVSYLFWLHAQMRRGTSKGSRSY